jgi:hypothetical protein
MDPVVVREVATGIGVGVALHFFFATLRKRARLRAKRDEITGDIILRCSNIVPWTMGAVAVVGTSGMLALSFLVPFPNAAAGIFIFLGIGAFFLLGGGGMCLWSIRRQTRIGVEGVTSEYVFASPQFFPWEEVTKVRFSGGEFWIHGPGRKKAFFHVIMFTGVRDAVPLVIEHLPQHVQTEYRKAIKGLIRATA